MKTAAKHLADLLIVAGVVMAIGGLYLLVGMAWATVLQLGLVIAVLVRAC